MHDRPYTDAAVYDRRASNAVACPIGEQIEGNSLLAGQEAIRASASVLQLIVGGLTVYLMHDDMGR